MLQQVATWRGSSARGGEIRTPHLLATHLKPRLAGDLNGNLLRLRRLLSRRPRRQRAQPHLKLERQFLDKGRLAQRTLRARSPLRRHLARSLRLAKPLALSSRWRGGGTQRANGAIAGRTGPSPGIHRPFFASWICGTRLRPKVFAFGNRSSYGPVLRPTARTRQ